MQEDEPAAPDGLQQALLAFAEAVRGAPESVARDFARLMRAHADATDWQSAAYAAAARGVAAAIDGAG